jgi:hypothetical protein
MGIKMIDIAEKQFIKTKNKATKKAGKRSKKKGLLL